MPSPTTRLGLIPPYLFSEIARVKREAIEKGADIIDLGIGDPDLPTPVEVREALKRAVEDPHTHRYDETPLGWYSFVDAAGEFYKREFGVDIDSRKEIIQLIGSKEGLAHLAWAYCDPGDVVITPNPAYTVYKVNSLMAGGEVFETPLKEENGFLPVIEDIPSDVAKRAKLFYVCYPNNPTGATASSEFYEFDVMF
jgi:LL-diaminopimelate aminotransferase